MTNIEYRQEIDGLRAIAVLSVLLFHANENIFSGGYIGVDIFFVISGYLISSIIFNDIKNKSFTILNFYERRIRRIIPALVLVLIFSFFLSLILLDPVALKFHSIAQITSLFFTSNILFSNSVNYFTDSFNPLLHTWSLGVEEQFYLIYPLIILILYKNYKKILFFLLILILLLSLLLGQFGGNFSITYPYVEREFFFFYESVYFDFFLVQSRIWEILLGCLTFFIYDRISAFKNSLPKLINNIILVFGLILVIAPIFIFTRALQIPSIFLLIPTMGTAIIILFYKSESVISLILVNKFSIFIGLISYSLYLWHFPIFSYFDIVTIDERNLTETIILICLSISISWISWKYIEKFFRNKELITKKKIFTLFLISIVFLSFANFIIYKNEGFPSRFSYEKIPDGSINLSDPIVNECWTEKINIHAGTCILGNTSKKPKFAIIGDSLIISHINQVNQIGLEKNIAIKLIIRGTCPPLKDIFIQPLSINRGNKNLEKCKILNDNLINLLKKDKIENVILISKWSRYFKGDYEYKNIKILTDGDNLISSLSLEKNAEYFEVGIKNRIKSFENENINYYIISQVPIQNYEPRKVYNYTNNKFLNSFLNTNDIDSFHLIKDKHDIHHQEINKIFKRIAGENYIDISEIICTNKCPIGKESIPYYLDKTHLSPNGSNYLLGAFFNKLIK